MVFAKHAGAKKALMDNWNQLVRERSYAAVVEGSIVEERRYLLDTWLVENRAGQVYGTSPGAQGALRAITHWKVLASNRRYSLVSLSLETGRKHQIRRPAFRSRLSRCGRPTIWSEKRSPGEALPSRHQFWGWSIPLPIDLYSFEKPSSRRFPSSGARARRRASRPNPWCLGTGARAANRCSRNSHGIHRFIQPPHLGFLRSGQTRNRGYTQKPLRLVEAALFQRKQARQRKKAAAHGLTVPADTYRQSDAQNVIFNVKAAILGP